VVHLLCDVRDACWLELKVHARWIVLFEILSSFLRKPHTDRFRDGVQKKLRRNRNCDCCEKNATGTEYTGIWRIPAGITNLGFQEYNPSLLSLLLWLMSVVILNKSLIIDRCVSVR
jgi:hypothetical protein